MRRAVPAAVPLGLVVLLAGCSGGPATSSAGTTAGSAAPSTAGASSPAPSGGSSRASTPDTDQATGATSPALSRSVARKGRVTSSGSTRPVAGVSYSVVVRCSASEPGEGVVYQVRVGSRVVSSAAVDCNTAGPVRHVAFTGSAGMQAARITLLGVGQAIVTATAELVRD